MTNTHRMNVSAAAGGCRAWCWAAALAAAVAWGPGGAGPASARESAAAGASAQPGRATTPGGTGGVNAPETLDKPYLVLVSFDGFRHDYLDRYATPSFDRVAARGVAAEALVPVYPPLTFPAHYSIVTGLHPERHGLVGNRFYDPARGGEYNYRDPASVADGTWYGGEPIWVTAETQGMVAAAMLLVGTEADIGGVRPTFWTRYADRGTHPRAGRRGPRLAGPCRPSAAPISSPCTSRRWTAPATAPAPRPPAVAEAVERVDADLGRLLDGIDALPHRAAVSVVLVSDHGMAEARPDAVIDLDAVADLRGVRAVVSLSGANLFVPGGEARARVVRDDVNDGTGGGNVLKGVRAYLRSEVPSALHYRAHPRIGDVVVIPDPGVTFDVGPPPPPGMHGWDPRHPDMHGHLPRVGTGHPARPAHRLRRQRRSVSVPRPPAASRPESRRGRRLGRPRTGARAGSTVKRARTC